MGLLAIATGGGFAVNRLVDMSPWKVIAAPSGLKFSGVLNACRGLNAHSGLYVSSGLSRLMRATMVSSCGGTLLHGMIMS